MSDVRCPDNESRLFFRITPEGNIEIACKDCRTKARRVDPTVDLVLHIYSAAGELLDTDELRLVRRGVVTHAYPTVRPGT